MPITLPAQARPRCPCQIIETAFARFEELIPVEFQDELLKEASTLGECKSNGLLQRNRADAFVSAAIVAVLPHTIGIGESARVGAIRGSASFAHTLLAMGRPAEAVHIAAGVLADSVGYRHGAEEGQRALWREMIGHLGALRRVE